MKLATPCTQQPCVNPTLRRGRCSVHLTPTPYDAEWQRLRLHVLAEEPFCYCGCGSLSVDVDHTTPIAEGGPRLDRANLHGYAHGCHSRKTRRENKRTDDVVRASQADFLAYTFGKVATQRGAV